MLWSGGLVPLILDLAELFLERLEAPIMKKEAFKVLLNLDGFAMAF